MLTIQRCTIFRRITQFCKQLFDDAQTAKNSQSTHEDGQLSLEIIPRDGHDISRRQISDNALKVLYRLHKAGYQAYLVGGGVRDLLLGQQPKDFDVVTDAKPEDIKKLFRNSRLVGRRFRLAHIMFGREIIEVATFRGHHVESDDKISKTNASGRLLRDNVYGSIDEDAQRRDFTVNALYYSIGDYSIRSYGGGIQDLRERTLRLIGDPETRYREDPVRMLRAVRFATKLGMEIEERTAAPIKQLAPLLKDIPAARMYEEVLKLFFAGKAVQNFRMLREYQLFTPLFPLVEAQLKEDPHGPAMRLLAEVMQNTDARIAEDKPVTPTFFYAAMLWYPLQARAQDIALESGLSPYDAFFAAMGDVFEQQCQTISIPRRFSVPARDIWQMQQRFERSKNGRAFKLLEHPKFRAAYDLLLLRAAAEGGNTAKLAQWWQQFVETDDDARKQLLQSGGNSRSGGQRNRNAQQRRRRPPRRKTGEGKPQASNGADE